MSYNDWMSYDLFDIAEVKTGKSNTIDAVEDGKYPLFDRSQIIKRSNKYLFDEVAILIPGEGQEFIPRFYKGKFDLHQRVYAVLPNDNIVNPKYFYYLMHHHKDTLSKIAVGTTVKSLRLSSFEFLEFKIPSLKIQNIVQQILSNLDEKIKLNNKINNNLEELAQTLYKHWFVDFEFPNEEGLPYKSSGGKMVESELGLIPSKFKVTTIEDNAETVLGGTPRRKNVDYWGRGYSWINSGALNQLRILEGTEEITQLGLDNSAAKMMPRGTTLIGITGYVGIVSMLEIDSSANQSVVGIIPNENLPKSYLYSMIKNEAPIISLKQTGSAQQHINKNDINTHKFIKPNRRLIYKYEKTVCHINEMIYKNLIESNKLEKLRDILLPKLMSGEIRVPIKE